MAKKPAVQNIFLDTQVFESNQFDLGSRLFQTLCTAVNAGFVRVYSTEVTKREIERHLKDRATEAVGLLKTFQKNLKIRCITLQAFTVTQAKVTSHAAHTDVMEQLMLFWENAKIETIPLAGANVEKVFEDYFSVQPPFGTGDKKSEFPDAFAADVLSTWCASKRQKMTVVSGDNDWKALCDGHPHLIHAPQLADLLASFPDPKISAAIRTAFLHRDYDTRMFVETSLTNSLLNTTMDGGIIIEFIIKKSEIQDVVVIQASVTSATVEVRCRLIYVTRVEYAPNTITYRVRSQWKSRRKFVTKTRVAAEFVLTLDPANPANYDVNTIDIHQLDRPYSEL